MYTLLVCADLYGDKCNLELNFASMPTITELQQKILQVFMAESNLRRPQGRQAVDFTIARIQIYDDANVKWADLVSETQLHEFDQLYVFQPQSVWHTDVQKDLPPPCPPSQSRTTSRVHSLMNTPYKYSGGTRPTSYRHDTSAASTSSSTALLPPKMRLEDQRRKEWALQEELVQTRKESLQLEREIAVEEEKWARDQEQRARLLREKEEEIRRQRETLMRMEEEFRILKSEAVQDGSMQ